MSLDVTVRFSKSTYGANEYSEAAQPLLLISHKPSTNITVVVYNNNGTAFGEY